MSKASAITTLILRKLWTLVAVVLVMFALLISLLRYSLPMLNDRVALIEDYAKDNYGVDLSIGSVAATWQSSGPSIQFEDVYVKQGEQSPLSLKVGDVYLAVEFWSSLFNRKLQSKNVTLADLQMDLDLTRVEASSDQNFAIVDALESLFLEQLSNFSVRNSEITLLTEANKKTIRINHLSWLNKGNRHQGLGELSLQGFASNTAMFILDLTGDVSSYDGAFYATGEDLDLSPWINEFTQIESNLLASKGNFSMWADISKGRLSAVRGMVEPSEFTWEIASGEILNTSFSAQFAAQPADAGWAFTVNEASILSSSNEFVSNWKGIYSLDEGVHLSNVTKLEVGDLLPFSKIFSESFAQQLTQINLQAAVPKLHIKADSAGLAFISQGSSLSWQEHEAFPGVDNVEFDLYWSAGRGALNLRADKSSLNATNLLGRQLPIDNLDFSMLMSADKSGVVLQSQRAQLRLDGLDIKPYIQYSSVDSQLKLLIDIDELPLKKVPSLLPNRYLTSNTKTYLSRALAGEGRIKDAHILWRGKTSGFPFEEGDGVFQAAVDIQNADFLFAERWPELEDLDINLLFENKSLSMRAESGRLLDVELNDLRADIPRLGRGSMLSIYTQGQGRGETLATVFERSTLADTLGKALSQDVLVKGEVTTDLALYIPISDLKNVRAVGKAYLQDAQVNIAALDLDLNQVTGAVSYDNASIDISGIQATLLSQPLAFDLTGRANEQKYALNIEAKGDWAMSPIIQRYANKLSDSIQGDMSWRLGLGINLSAGEFDYTAKLSSNLTRLNSSLPAPFKKRKDEALPLVLLASGNNIASNIDLNLGADVNFNGILPHKEKQFSRAHLALGKTDFVGMGVGFSISANLPSVELTPWMTTVNQIVGELGQGGTPILSAPERIFAQTDQLLAAGSRITDVNIIAKRLERDWQLDIDADQIRGRIDISDEWVSRGVRIDADYIRLSDFDLEKGASRPVNSFDPKTLPSINLICQSCEIANVELGRVVFEAAPNDDGLEINRLQVETENGDINATGQWYQRHDDHFTFISGGLDSDDFGRMLSGFGFESGIRDSQAELDFTLTWQDSPADFSFESLDGQINWALTDGYLAEVSDKGSRIFTLLSLNSLVRKLSLDFRDVFAKGFFYDEMEGSVQITDGKADTRDTNIDGAAGEIEIYGFTDLVSKSLNYNISFTPNVTGNLPVLVYFFTVSPPSALAALAIDQVLTSAKVISNVNYSVSGTLDEPILIETGRQSTDVALPTRRDPSEEEQRPLFLPPTEDDLLPIEREDG